LPIAKRNAAKVFFKGKSKRQGRRQRQVGVGVGGPAGVISWMQMHGGEAISFWRLVFRVSWRTASCQAPASSCRYHQVGVDARCLAVI
jgi:hypothetical protein